MSRSSVRTTPTSSGSIARTSPTGAGLGRSRGRETHWKGVWEKDREVFKMAQLAIVADDEAREKSTDDLFARLETSVQGLTSAEVQKRLAQFGPNSLPERKLNPLLKF